LGCAEAAVDAHRQALVAGIAYGIGLARRRVASGR
jgi:hypothetical protein